MAGIHDVRWFVPDMAGCPAPRRFINTAQKFFDILDACLVNGFNVQAVTQIVVSNGTAEATTSAADHGFRDHSVVRIAGSGSTDLDGDWKVAVSSGNKFSFPTSAANGTYNAGGMSAKVAPLGWTKDYSATDVAVYRTKGGLRRYLRVDGTQNVGYAVRVRGYEGKTDASEAGTNPFPTQAQLGNLYWNYGHVAYSNSDNPWFLVGDDRSFYLTIPQAEQNGLTLNGDTDTCLCWFGDINNYGANDTGHCGIVGSTTYGANNPTQNGYSGFSQPGNGGNSYGFTGCYLARPFSQAIGAPVRFRPYGSAVLEGWAHGSLPGVTQANPVDGAIVLHAPIHVGEEIVGGLRGEMPGIYQPLNRNIQSRRGDVLQVGDRRVMLARAPDGNWGTTARMGVAGFDITGPWR